MTSNFLVPIQITDYPQEQTIFYRSIYNLFLFDLLVGTFGNKLYTRGRSVILKDNHSQRKDPSIRPQANSQELTTSVL
jgi:hypothetical protein